MADPVGDQHHLALGGEVLEQEGELVAAEAGHGVHRAQHRAQASAQRDQHPVADRVTAGVVDLLEVVEVEEHDGRLGSRAAGALERHSEPVEKQGTVGEPGQLVVESLVGEVGLRALALDRVRERAPEHGRLKFGLDQAILGAGLDRIERERLVVVRQQQHDRRVRSGQPHVLEQVERGVLPLGRYVEQHAARRMVDECLRSGGVPLGVGQQLHATPVRVQELVDQPRGMEIGGQQQDPHRACVDRIHQ